MSGSPYEARTIWELVEISAAASPDAPMLIDAADRQVTFRQFRDRAERVAAGLGELGIGDGTPVTWQLPSSIDTVVLAVALARVGGLQNPILHIYRSREVAAALAGMRPEFFFSPGTWRGFDYAAMADAVAAGLERAPALVSLGELPEADPAALPPRDVRAGDEAPVRWIYYTSGTTSDPKGVRHTDATLLAWREGAREGARAHSGRRRVDRVPVRARRGA